MRSRRHGQAPARLNLNCSRVQDPYSFRCQPQGDGCLFGFDSPLQRHARSGRPSRHRQPAAVREGRRRPGSGETSTRNPWTVTGPTRCELALAEIGSLSERRMAVLVDQRLSGLPAFVGREQRREFRFHDRASHRRGSGVGTRPSPLRAASIRSRPPPIRKTTLSWRPMPHAA